MRCLVVAVSVMIACGAGTASGWQEALDQLLLSPGGPEQDALLEDVVAADPDWQEVVHRIESLTFGGIEERGVPILRSTVCTDTVERPWVLLVPAAYDPATPTPLLVVLHGAASRPEVMDDPLGYVDENLFAGLALDTGWLAVFPFAQEGATWWDQVGMANIGDLVRTVKRECNVDDDRVWMAGFSDGASAAFLHAMVAPSDYAAFVALNGHMGVGSEDGDLPTYAPNMANTPTYAVTTLDDRLYPSERMRPAIDMARRAGGDILYRELRGEHDFAYADDELPRIARFLERHPRDPFPTRIVWEAAEGDFGRCRWFVIDRVTTDDAAEWHTDYNAILVNDRVTVGFHPDYDFEGVGVKVAGVVDDDYPARRMGLKEGDTIIAAGGKAIENVDDLNAFKEGVARGDDIELTVIRDGEEVVLHGEIPEPQNYFVFKRDVPSAAARVSFSANRIDLEGSRLGAFRVLVHPDMIRLEGNLTIRVNGETVYHAPVEPDVRFLLENFLEDRDRRLLYVAEVAIGSG